MVKDSTQEIWDDVISPQHNLLSLNLKEVWRYRDLLLMFVKRDFVTFYKQTILGPIWFFVQPIFTTIIFTFVFGNLAQISTDDVPPVLFYLAGITCWNYFADSFNKTSTTFVTNQAIFGKVYFPRLIVPLSIVTSNLMKFGIQLSLFLGVWGYFLLTTDAIQPNIGIVIVPFLVLMMAGLSLGTGLIITSLTTKYRDMTFLLQFGIQLLMYGTPVIYPLSTVPDEYKWLVLINPMTSIIETFKYAFIGKGTFELSQLGVSLVLITLVLLIGIIIFNRTEKNFMDTV